jgi:hypothetical protein
LSNLLSAKRSFVTCLFANAAEAVSRIDAGSMSAQFLVGPAAAVVRVLGAVDPVKVGRAVTPVGSGQILTSRPVLASQISPRKVLALVGVPLAVVALPVVRALAEVAAVGIDAGSSVVARVGGTVVLLEAGKKSLSVWHSPISCLCFLIKAMIRSKY